MDELVNNRYSLLKLFQPFVESTKLFPIHSYGKTVTVVQARPLWLKSSLNDLLLIGIV